MSVSVDTAPATGDGSPMPGAGCVLGLRTCKADMTSYGGFRWPESGPVEAPDWDPAPHCGNGLHMWLWGEGDGGLGDWTAEARWLVVHVQADQVVDLRGKVKFPRGEVVHCGDRESATRYLAEHGGAGRAIIGATATAGDAGTATAGGRGTATAGYAGTATAGYAGTATAGHEGTATAGDRGTATAGDRGTATAGYAGTATAGDEGVVIFFWWDSRSGRRRLAVGAVGKDGIEPGKPYRCVDGKIIPASEVD